MRPSSAAEPRTPTTGGTVMREPTSEADANPATHPTTAIARECEEARHQEQGGGRLGEKEAMRRIRRRSLDSFVRVGAQCRQVLPDALLTIGCKDG